MGAPKWFTEKFRRNIPGTMSSGFSGEIPARISG